MSNHEDVNITNVTGKTRGVAIGSTVPDMGTLLLEQQQGGNRTLHLEDVYHVHSWKIQQSLCIAVQGLSRERMSTSGRSK